MGPLNNSGESAWKKIRTLITDWPAEIMSAGMLHQDEIRGTPRKGDTPVLASLEVTFLSLVFSSLAQDCLMGKSLFENDSS